MKKWKRRIGAAAVVVVVLGAFSLWAAPKSEPMTYTSHTGYYIGFDFRGAPAALRWLGPYWQSVTGGEPGNSAYFRVELNGMGFNPFKSYYPDGTLQQEGACYVSPNGPEKEPFPNLHRLDWARCYKPDGTLASEVVDGTGTQTLWTPDGTKTWELKLEDGQRAELKMWYPSGQLGLEQPYRDGQKHGSFTAYHPNGNKKTEGAYRNGDRAGKWIRYNEDGTVKSTEDYREESEGENEGEKEP